MEKLNVMVMGVVVGLKMLLTQENFVSGNLSGKHRLVVKTEHKK